MTDSLWSVEDIRLGGSDRQRLVVDRLVIPGGCTAVLGESGAGKTSLLNLLVGFETPDSGRICGPQVVTEDRLPLFWIPPDLGLWPQATAGEHLQAVLPATATTGRRRELLHLLALEELEQTTPGELSAGERSRLAVARGLAAAACVLVADEPLVHVDAHRIDLFWQRLVDECRSADSHLLFATHAPTQVLRHADHVIVLDDGQPRDHGPVRRVYLNPNSRRVAEALGPVNWFDSRDGIPWGVGNGDRNICLRPEHTEIVPDDGGPLVVRQSRDVGVLRESTLTLAESDAGPRMVLHLAAGPCLVSGQHVRLENRSPDDAVV